MGTRNLTMVYLDGEFKIAQYGQWDGYPEGQGMTCLKFLREKMDKEKFLNALRNLSWINDEELSDLWRSFGADDDGMISWENADRFKKSHPEYSRDTGAEILSLVQNGNAIKLENSVEFAANGLSCEWAWLIDFDAGTFEAYEGRSDRPLTEEDRFFFLRDKEENTGYHGIVKVAEWSLDDLPSEEDFLKEFKGEE